MRYKFQHDRNQHHMGHVGPTPCQVKSAYEEYPLLEIGVIFSFSSHPCLISQMTLIKWCGLDLQWCYWVMVGFQVLAPHLLPPSEVRKFFLGDVWGSERFCLAVKHVQTNRQHMRWALLIQCLVQIIFKSVKSFPVKN